MGTLNVGVGTSAAGPYTTEFTWTGQLQTSGSDAWVNVGVDLSAYVGSTIYIAFTQYDTVTGQLYAGDMSIDEMTVTTCVACAAPSGLIASNVSADAADLAWTENGSATEWQVSYGAAGFTAGAGTEFTVATTTSNLSALSSETAYDVYVRAICGPGDSSAWTSVASFTTLPSCFVPTGAAVANVTDVSADFSWTDANNIPAPAEYQVSYGAAGFTAGAGTEFTVTDTTSSLSALSSETAYDVYVRAICGAGDH